MSITVQAKYLKQLLKKHNLVNANNKLSVTTEKNSDGSYGDAVSVVNLLTEEQQNVLNDECQWLSIANFEELNRSVIRY